MDDIHYLKDAETRITGTFASHVLTLPHGQTRAGQAIIVDETKKLLSLLAGLERDHLLYPYVKRIVDEWQMIVTEDRAYAHLLRPATQWRDTRVDMSSFLGDGRKGIYGGTCDLIPGSGTAASAFTALWERASDLLARGYDPDMYL